MENKSHSQNIQKLISKDTFYTIGEIADCFNITERTIRRYCETKIFEHAVKIGKKKWVIPGCDILMFLSADESIEDSMQSLNNDYIEEIDDDEEVLSW